MRYLESFQDKQPDKSTVDMWQNYIEQQYSDKIFDTEFGKMVQIDDKTYFLNNKTDVVNRMFFEISNNIRGKIHEPSLRRAIKNWINNI